MILGRGKQHKCTLDICFLFQSPENIKFQQGSSQGTLKTDFEEVSLRNSSILTFYYT